MLSDHFDRGKQKAKIRTKIKKWKLLLQAETQPTLDLSAKTKQWSSVLAQGEEGNR